MKFDFFTFGGSQFWEDVFFYQKWRIQRNYKTKKYRLLDNWDIRRFEGTFEQCRQAFVKFIEVYEISRQKGHMVIMLHGLGDTKNIFKPLWRRTLDFGYMAAAINYPSTRKDMESQIRQLDFLMNNLEDVNEVSFVTKGVGGILLRKLLSKNSPWIEKIKINRVVQINPPNQGSKWLSMLSKSRLMRWIYGPMLAEMAPENVAKIPNFSKNTEVAVIYGDFAYKSWSAFLPAAMRKNLPSKEECELPGIKEMAVVKNDYNNLLNNQKINTFVTNFLSKGKIV